MPVPAPVCRDPDLRRPEGTVQSTVLGHLSTLDVVGGGECGCYSVLPEGPDLVVRIRGKDVRNTVGSVIIVGYPCIVDGSALSGSHVHSDLLDLGREGDRGISQCLLMGIGDILQIIGDVEDRLILACPIHRQVVYQVGRMLT